MNKLAVITICAAMAVSCTSASSPKGLKDALADKFLVGTALNEQQILHKDPKADSLIKLHFNAIVAENCMKHEEIHPKEGVYKFDLADKFVHYGEENNLAITGHCLIWHSQCAPWFFVDGGGNFLPKEVLKERMREHIFTVMQRYKGKVLGWDVVNEAIMEDGSYRQSNFYNILGEEYIPWAFKCAMEADPDAELYLNDYNMYAPGKVETVKKIIRSLKAEGIRIDAVGMQCHIGMDYPELSEFRSAMEAYIAEGVNVAITELDMSALPTISTTADVGASLSLLLDSGEELTAEQKADREKAMVAFNEKYNPYTAGLPEDISKAWNDRMKSFFDLFEEFSDHVCRVTAWGLTDGDSWKNDFMAHRTDYPLLFDRDYKAKPFVNEIIKGE